MTLKNIMLAGAAFVALAGTAAAETPAGFYVEGALGANWLQDLDSNFGTVAAPRTINFDTGFYGEVSAGYKNAYGFRFAGQIGYRTNQYDIGTGLDNGHGNTFSIMGNVLYDIDVAPGLVLSVGGGLGTARVGLHDPLFLDNRDWHLAYQGIAEAEYMVSDNLGVFGGYNYFRVNHFELDSLAGNQDTYQANTGYLGLRYHFFEPAKAPPPPPPAPPPVAAKTFIVFFGFDKSDLTPEARAVVAEAAAAYKQTGAVSIAVVGHTDTVGSAAYNQPLSERRAASVKAGLVANGVTGNSVSTTGKGFSEPLVATGPGVKEPQNRRATIDLSGSAT